jgi:hypothetical protein
MVGGQPDIDTSVTPYSGYVLSGEIASTGWGAYLISGTGAQLLAIDALAQVVGIVAVTQSGDVRWGELDDALSSVVRTKINNWLSARGLQTIPDGWTNGRVVREIFQRANSRWELSAFDIRGPEDV